MEESVSKRQVKVTALPDRRVIRPDADIEWRPVGDIRVIPVSGLRTTESRAMRLQLFDAATRRQNERQRGRSAGAGGRWTDRGWLRDDLYDRARAG